jgi:hypothetical protein
VRTGNPVVCSTLTSAAPGIARTIAETRFACARSVSRSSPKIFTATSLRTPEISSLNRSSIGLVISKL